MSRDTIECECRTCRSYCCNRPGFFAPGEAEGAAELLGVSLEELFRSSLVVEFWQPQDGADHTYLLAPATVGRPAGGLAPLQPRGVCVFYTEGRCAIHATKPLECRLADHRARDGMQEERAALVERWRTPEGRAQIEALWGRPLPEHPAEAADPRDLLTGLVELTLEAVMRKGAS